MAESVQHPQLRAGRGGGLLGDRPAKPRGAVAAAEDQNGNGDLPELGLRHAARGDGQVEGKRARERLQRGHPGGAVQLREGLVGEPDDFGHPERDGLAVAAGADQLADALVRVDVGHRRVVVAERRLVGDDAGDGQPGRDGAQRDRRAGGMAEHERGPGAGRGRDGGKVLVLPLRRDRTGVAAVAAATTVVGHDGELPRQVAGDDERGASGECAIAHDQHRAFAGAVVGDRGPVGGRHRLHEGPPS